MPAEVVADEQQVDEQQLSGNRGWAWMLVVGSTIGFLASMILTIDRFKLLTDPQTVLVCDISPFVTCGPVMSSRAGALFGFPNPLLGIAGFALAGTTGMVLLAGARLARWYLACFEVGCLLAVIFLTWLQAQTLYVIGALCIWCMCVWAVTIPIVRGDHREDAERGSVRERSAAGRPDRGQLDSPDRGDLVPGDPDRHRAALPARVRLDVVQRLTDPRLG